MSQGGYQKEINGHRVILIEYWHPANRFPSMMNYYALMVMYQRALQMTSN